MIDCPECLAAARDALADAVWLIEAGASTDSPALIESLAMAAMWHDLVEEDE